MTEFNAVNINNTNTVNGEGNSSDHSRLCGKMRLAELSGLLCTVGKCS